MQIRFICVILLLLCFPAISSAAGRPRVAIMDFSAAGVTEDDAAIVTEIFRSKIITSCVFDVLERKNLQNILAENKLGLSGLIGQPARIGELLGAEYLITGSFMKMGGNLMISVNLIKVETGNIIGTSEMTIANMDSVYDSLTLLTTRLIKASFGMDKFTFSTETEGPSLEFAANGLSGAGGRGVGLTLGFTSGRANFWGGYSTTWNFTDIKSTVGFGLENKLIAIFGSGNFIIGNKVEGAALLLGLGAGYDFQAGILINPFIGGYYRNIYLKYSRAMVLDPSGDKPLRGYNMIEAGYSIFLGSKGKETANFK